MKLVEKQRIIDEKTRKIKVVKTNDKPNKPKKITLRRVIFRP